MKIGTCKIGNTTLNVVNKNGAYRFETDPLVMAIHDAKLDLNALHLAFLMSQKTDSPISAEKYLVFKAQGGYSVSGLRDVEESAMGMNEHLFPNYVSIIGQCEYD